MSYITEKVTTERKIKVLPCIECGSENIDINDCGYSSFNVAWGKCKDCGNEAQIKCCSCDISKRTIAKTWNNANDPKKLLAQCEKQLVSLKARMKKLRAKIR
jgi:hypothetical protein